MAFVIDNPEVRKSLRRGFQFEDEVCEHLRVELPDEYGIFPSVLVEARKVFDSYRGQTRSHGHRPGPAPAPAPKLSREIDFLVCGPTGLFVIDAKSQQYVRGPFLGKWALKALYSIHKVTQNYGWSIIILTCILQVLLFPLSLKSYKSMALMKKLQPKILDIQTRYKDDSKRMNQEMIDLYKHAGTNPFGGCLPMIMQVPVFWAFFTMLRDAYELRGAHWIFWIKDLSQADTLFTDLFHLPFTLGLLPLVMGGGMLAQQKISGSTGDPTQAKMMMFMPFVFTFMFLKFPSGLVLYWLTNSIVSTATQYWCSRKYGNISPKKVSS